MRLFAAVRRLLSPRRLRRAVVVAGLAGVLSVSLVVGTPSNAQAFADGGIISGPAIVGGTVAAGGTVATGVLIASGVGLLVLAAVAVVGAHEAGMFKYPWEQADNPLSTADKAPTASPPGKEAVNANDGYNTIIASPTMTMGVPTQSVNYTYSIIVPITYSGAFATNASYSFMAHADVECRNTTTGARSFRVQGSAGVVKSVTFYSSDADHTAPKNMLLSCAGGEQVIDANIRPLTPGELATYTDTAGWPTNIYTNWVGPAIERWWHRQATDYDTPTIDTTVNCVLPDGTKNQLHTSEPVTTDGSVNIPSCSAAGFGIAESVISNFLDGGKIRGNPLIDIHKGDTAYTGCDPALGQVCKMQIYVDGVPCVVGSPACASWAGLARVNPGRVQCYYGGNVVDISGCGIIEGAYVTGGTPYVKDNIDGDPNTWQDPAKIPGYVPHIDTPAGPEADPTVTPGPAPSPSPPPDIGTDPTPDPTPDPGGDPTPDPFPNDGSSPSDDCVSPTWSWNPVDWVKSPVICAIKAVFVPKTDVKTGLTDLQNKLKTKPPVSWLVVPPVFSGPGGGACPGWTVTVGAFSENVVCGSSFTNAVVGSRGFIFALVLVGMIWPLIRSVWYAAIPILRVSPSGGGK
jgi:hypothetical protein